MTGIPKKKEKLAFLETYFYKNQSFFFLIALAFFSYAMFYYVQNKNLERNSKLEKMLIVDKSCNAGSKSVSSIKVTRNGKTYSVQLPYSKCLELNIWGKVGLYYNEKYDYYYLPGLLRIYLIRVVVTALVLILLVLPLEVFI
jgi:hypothetical protein